MVDSRQKRAGMTRRKRTVMPAQAGIQEMEREMGGN
jgi:hypothetical protein